jgi:hypothetical protein
LRVFEIISPGSDIPGLREKRSEGRNILPSHDLPRALFKFERAMGLCQGMDIPLWSLGQLRFWGGVHPGPGAPPTPCLCSCRRGNGRPQRKWAAIRCTV